MIVLHSFLLVRMYGGNLDLLNNFCPFASNQWILTSSDNNDESRNTNADQMTFWDDWCVNNRMFLPLINTITSALMWTLCNVEYCMSSICASSQLQPGFILDCLYYAADWPWQILQLLDYFTMRWNRRFVTLSNKNLPYLFSLLIQRSITAVEWKQQFVCGQFFFFFYGKKFAVALL